jgi:oxygen-dependent protoporphyrinogen oxidase
MPGPGQDLYSMAWSLFTEPIFKGLIKDAIFEFTRPPRPRDLEDESVGSFLERRLGSSDPGNNIVSAVLHGIYAGDIYQLSIKSLVPRLWHQEGVHGSIIKGMLESLRTQTVPMPYRDAMLQNKMVDKLQGPLLNSMGAASVYTFKQGIGQLSSALEKSLQGNKNVEFKMGHKISNVEYDAASDGIKVFFPPYDLAYTYVSRSKQLKTNLQPNTRTLSQLFLAGFFPQSVILPYPPSRRLTR